MNKKPITPTTMAQTSAVHTRLHALTPTGLGTARVESLTSYFCRLANSHSCTTTDLAHLVLAHIAPGRWITHQNAASGKSRFNWYERSISGSSSGALQWAGALGELTGVTTLHKLTLLPTSGSIATQGLMATQARWCPQCLQEDRDRGQAPYFRLAWDVGANTVCTRHGVPLVAVCPHCNKSNVRHAASIVIPGWCAACGGFLGEPSVEPEPSPDPHEAWVARAVGQLVAATSGEPDGEDVFRADLEACHAALERIIEVMDGGVAAHFARRLGVRKSTVHHWRHASAAPTLAVLLRISLACDIALPDLLRGELAGWRPPERSRQLALQLALPARPEHAKTREVDLDAIRAALELEATKSRPRSVTAMARALGVNERMLYEWASDEARRLGQHYVQSRGERARQQQAALRGKLKAACLKLQASGEGVTVAGVERIIGEQTIATVQNLYGVLSTLAKAAANEDASPC